MQTVGERLKIAREAAGHASAAEAARQFEWHPQNVRDHEADRRGVSPEQARTYARAYRVEPNWILYGGADPKAKAAPTLVKVIGRVGANPDGQVLFANGQESGDLVPLPPGGTERAVALEVRGHSMRGWADDGSLIYFEEQHSQPTPDMVGYPVVCELESGEVLVKRLLKGDRPGVFDLESIAGPTISNARIKWVAEVTAVIPPRAARRIIVRGPIRR